MEGQFWSGGVIDEIADVKAEAWQANIRPALDTYNPQRPGDARVIAGARQLWGRSSFGAVNGCAR